jgi:hypothetical protein
VGTTTVAAAAKPDSSPKKKKWGKPKKGKTTKEEVADIMDKVIAGWVDRSCIFLTDCVKFHGSSSSSPTSVIDGYKPAAHPFCSAPFSLCVRLTLTGLRGAWRRVWNGRARPRVQVQ